MTPTLGTELTHSAQRFTRTHQSRLQQFRAPHRTVLPDCRQARPPQRLRHFLRRAGKRPILESESRLQSSLLVFGGIQRRPVSAPSANPSRWTARSRPRTTAAWRSTALSQGFPTIPHRQKPARRPERTRTLFARSASGHALHAAVAPGSRVPIARRHRSRSFLRRLSRIEALRFLQRQPGRSRSWGRTRFPPRRAAPPTMKRPAPPGPVLWRTRRSNCNPALDVAIDTFRSNAQSNYNSLQVRLEKRYSHGLQYEVAYTCAHALDNASSASLGSVNNGDFQDQRYPNQNYGNADFDVRHRFVFSYVYDLPFGRGRMVRQGRFRRREPDYRQLANDGRLLRRHRQLLHRDRHQQCVWRRLRRHRWLLLLTPQPGWQSQRQAVHSGNAV